MRFNGHSTLLEYPFSVSTPLDESVEIRFAYMLCDILIEGRRLLVNLNVMEMLDFDVILGMDWLSAYHAIVDY